MYKIVHGHCWSLWLITVTINCKLLAVKQWHNSVKLFFLNSTRENIITFFNMSLTTRILYFLTGPRQKYERKNAILFYKYILILKNLTINNFFDYNKYYYIPISLLSNNINNSIVSHILQFPYGIFISTGNIYIICKSESIKTDNGAILCKYNGNYTTYDGNILKPQLFLFLGYTRICLAF